MRTVSRSHPASPQPQAFAAQCGAAAPAQARGDHTIEAFLDRFNSAQTGQLPAWGPNADLAAATSAYLDGLVRAAQESLQAREPRPREALIKAAYQTSSEDGVGGNPHPIGTTERSDKGKGGVGGNPHRIGSPEWLKMGKRDGVWFPFPAPHMSALKELSKRRTYPTGHLLEHGLNLMRIYLHACGFEPNPQRKLEKETGEIKDNSIFTSKKLEERLKKEVAELSERVFSSDEERMRVLEEKFHAWADQLARNEFVGAGGADAHSAEIERIVKLLGNPETMNTVSPFVAAVEDGWVDACRMMSELADDASPEQLAAVAKEAMKPKRLNIRVQHTGKNGEIDGEGNVKAAEYDHFLDKDLPLAAASLFWTHLRIGDKDWSAGNVWQVLNAPNPNIGLTVGSLRDHRSAQNMRALNGAQLASMRSVAKELGFEVYDSKAKASEDVAHALRRFREENRAGLMRLAMDHPAHFAQLQEAMLAIVRAAAEGKEVLQDRLDGWLPTGPGTASAGLEPSRSGP